MFDTAPRPPASPRALTAALAALFALVCACDSAPIVAPDDAGAALHAAQTTGDRSAGNGAARGATAPKRARSGAEHDWNDAQIAWQPYEAGLARAKADGKPVCLVVSTTWCTHCLNYSRVFHDPRVVERARELVMIRADADNEPAVAEKHAPDGAYIPRTFFLSSSGVVDADIHPPRDRFRYFYDERDPSSLLAGMAAAVQKLKK